MKLNAAGVARYLRKPDPAVLAALLYGPNNAAVAEAAAAITVHVVGKGADRLAVTRLSDDELRRDKARLMDELSAQSLLGGARLVRLQAQGETGSDAVAAALAEIDKGFAPAAFLLVEAGDLGPRSALRQAFEGAERAAALPFYEDSPETLAEQARQLLAEAKALLDREAQDLFFAQLPEDRGVLRAEIEKIGLYAHGLGRGVTPAEILALGVAAGAGEEDEAAAASIAGDLRKMEDVLGRVGHGRGVGLLKALERRLLRLLELHTLMRAGASESDAMGRLRPPILFLEKPAYGRALRAWSPARLASALDLVWDAELQAKRAASPADDIAAAALRDAARLIAGKV